MKEEKEEGKKEKKNEGKNGDDCLSKAGGLSNLISISNIMLYPSLVLSAKRMRSMQSHWIIV